MAIEIVSFPIKHGGSFHKTPFSITEIWPKPHQTTKAAAEPLAGARQCCRGGDEGGGSGGDGAAEAAMSVGGETPRPGQSR